MPFKIAVRESLPVLISLVGTSGSGKTMTALMLASGLAGEDGDVGLIDTESGRGSMYADNAKILSALPNKQYYINEIKPPFTPVKFINAILEAEKAGMSVLIVDSITAEWEGTGGCADIAENSKLRGMPNWGLAKGEHKKLMNVLLRTNMHVIVCLRARDKSKPIKDEETGKIRIVDMGKQPIQEKNFMFDMTLSLLLDEENAGTATVLKCPEPLKNLFNKETYVDKDKGFKIKEWADNGTPINKILRRLKADCEAAAAQGNSCLTEVLKKLTKEEKDVSKLIDDESKKSWRKTATKFDTTNTPIDQTQGGDMIEIGVSEEDDINNENKENNNGN